MCVVARCQYPLFTGLISHLHKMPSVSTASIHLPQIVSHLHASCWLLSRDLILHNWSQWEFSPKQWSCSKLAVVQMLLPVACMALLPTPAKWFGFFPKIRKQIAMFFFSDPKDLKGQWWSLGLKVWFWLWVCFFPSDLFVSIYIFEKKN